MFSDIQGYASPRSERLRKERFSDIHGYTSPRTERERCSLIFMDTHRQERRERCSLIFRDRGIAEIGKRENRFSDLHGYTCSLIITRKREAERFPWGVGGIPITLGIHIADREKRGEMLYIVRDTCC